MTAFEAIQEALSGMEIPLTPYTYRGEEEKYITYNYASDSGADFGDDAPECDLTSVQVHYFMPIVNAKRQHESFLQAKKQIRAALFAAGFTYPQITVMEETDTNTWHLVFECEYIED